jgi:ribosomal-protein-alanine N-acetyltransferase
MDFPSASEITWGRTDLATATAPRAPCVVRYTMTAFERIATDRLVLRRPVAQDAAAIFAAYAHDAKVTRYLSWLRHTSVAQSSAFIDFSDAEWTRWPAGPYIIETRRGIVIGGTGFSFQTAQRAETGYVLARPHWGNGYATEALKSLIAVAGELGVRQLCAFCHVEQLASCRVLEKCEFSRDGILRDHTEFPNDRPGQLQDAISYSRNLGGQS